MAYLRSSFNDLDTKKEGSVDHARPQFGESFTPSFWAVDDLSDPDKVNCEIKFEPMRVAFFDTIVDLKVPVITNSDSLSKGTDLVKAKNVPDAAGEDPSSSEEEPPAKRRKSKGKGKSK